MTRKSSGWGWWREINLHEDTRIYLLVFTSFLSSRNFTIYTLILDLLIIGEYSQFYSHFNVSDLLLLSIMYSTTLLFTSISQDSRKITDFCASFVVNCNLTLQFLRTTLEILLTKFFYHFHILKVRYLSTLLLLKFFFSFPFFLYLLYSVCHYTI